jgi:hypothetical protein
MKDVWVVLEELPYRSASGNIQLDDIELVP